MKRNVGGKGRDMDYEQNGVKTSALFSISNGRMDGLNEIESETKEKKTLEGDQDEIEMEFEKTKASIDFSRPCRH